MVAHDPGDWFEESLASFADQTYENLSVIVVDAGSAAPLAERVAAVLPDARVRRIEGNPGFAAAVNSVSETVSGSAFHLVCHDDVALDPDCTKLLVEEAFRSNAGVVGPKLVRWDDPDRLLAVGKGADRLGQPSWTVEPGELDQSQHEVVREVFAVPGAVTLVRSDLLAALGGFDDAMTLHGEHLDLCWRAHVAGARVVVAPAARVRHLEALGVRRPVDDRRRLQMRHRLRAMLVSSSTATRVISVPMAIVLTFVEAVYAVFTGRFAQAREVVGAWSWNLRRYGEIRRRRRAVNAIRTVPDSEIRAVQVPGSARVDAYLKGRIGRSEDRVSVLAGVGRAAGTLRSSSVRTSLVAWFAVLVVLLAGSRNLLTGGIPVVGDFVAFPGSAGDLFEMWRSGHRPIGAGVEAPAPPALGFFGLASVVAFGSTDLARTLLVVAMLPIGAAGAWRLVRPVGSRRARIASLLVFVANPLTYNALARGRWGALVLCALAPWIILQLAQASRVAPYGPVGGPVGPGGGERPLMRHVASLGVLGAIVGLWVPAAPLIIVVMALAMAVGALAVGHLAGAWRSVVAALGGAVVSAVLLGPWALSILARPGDSWWAASLGDAPAIDLGALLRFQTGPIGASLLGWSLLVGSSLGIIIGREWRLAWAARGWALAIGSWGAVYVVEQGWMPEGWPVPVTELMLAPAVAGLALAAAMGMAAFEVDLPDYRFGWRQVASVVAAAGVVVAFLPVLASAVGGRWDLPERDAASKLDFGEVEGASYRMLWVGDPDLVPVAGWGLGDPGADTERQRLVFATSLDGAPGIENLWLAKPQGGTERLGQAVKVAVDGGTNRLGSLLAPMGVRYVVVPDRLAPGSADPDDVVPAVLVDVMNRQLDLAPVPVGDGAVVFENRAYAPARALLAEGAVLDDDPALVGPDGLDGATAVLSGPLYASDPGPVPAESEVYLAAQDAPGWRLEVDGREVPGRRVLGWARSFPVDAGGEATLSHSTPIGAQALNVAPVLAWVLVLGYLLRARSRSQEVPLSDPELEIAAEGVQP